MKDTPTDLIPYAAFLVCVLTEYAARFGGFPVMDWEWNALEDEAQYRHELYQKLTQSY